MRISGLLVHGGLPAVAGVDRRRVLCITPAMPDYLPPDRYSTDYVIAGPGWPDRSEAGKVVSVKTSSGPFDVREVTAKCGGRDFDHVVVAYTAYGTVQPRGLDRLSCPVTLSVGDTHHGTYPLQCLLNYVSAERFDSVITGWRQSHAHWLLSIGLGDVGWLVGQDTRHTPVTPRSRRTSEAVFVGQTGKWHPRRAPAITRLWDSGLPVRVVRTAAPIAARLYASVAVSLNMALNNDINSRVFEVLSAGGCLLTDRLEPQSGMHTLFREGEHFVGYDGDDELVSQIQWMLTHPEQSEAIAMRGHAEYVARHLPEFRNDRFWDFVEHRSDELIRNLDYEPRVAAARRVGPIQRDVLVERMRTYEFLQEQVRVRSGVRVLYSAGVEPLTVADSADLSRLHRAYACYPDQAPTAWEALQGLGVAAQVVPTQIGAAVEDVWDLIVIGSEEFLEPHVINLLARVRFGRIAVAGNGKPVPPSRRMLLAQLGWVPDPEWPSLHVRASEPDIAELSHGATNEVSQAVQALPLVAEPAVDGAPIAVTDEAPEVWDSHESLRRAHDTFIGFAWDEVATHLPTDLNAFAATGIIESIAQSRPVDGSGRPIPGFVHAATDFVEPLLRPDWRAHIWGNGADLLWWSTRVATVTAVVTNGAYDPTHVAEAAQALHGVRFEDADSETYAEVTVPDERIDVGVVGGEVPERCVVSLLRGMSESGLIVIENSDRVACADAVLILATAGWRRIDFWGLLPQYLFRGCTSVFYKDDRFVSPAWTPDQLRSSLGPSFAQVTAQ